MGERKATASIAAILFLAGALNASAEQDSPQLQQTKAPTTQEPAQDEQNRAAVPATSSEPAIKDKDIWEGTGYFQPFRRMPRFVVSDQKRLWTSPFHMTRQDVKYWAIFGAATGVLIGFDEQIHNN